MSTVTLFPATFASGLFAHAIPNSRRSNANVAWMPMRSSGMGARETALDRERQGDLLRDAVDRERPDGLPLPARLLHPPALEPDLRVFLRVEPRGGAQLAVPRVASRVDARRLDHRDDLGLRKIGLLPGLDPHVVAHELAGDLRDPKQGDGEL